MGTLIEDVADLVHYDDDHSSGITCKADHYEHMSTVISKLHEIAVEHDVVVLTAKQRDNRGVSAGDDDSDWFGDIVEGVGEVIGEVLS